MLRTRPASVASISPYWNEELIFVVAEPFDEVLRLLVEERIGPKVTFKWQNWEFLFYCFGMPCSFTWVCQFECCFVLHILSALCYYVLICCPISQLVSLHFWFAGGDSWWDSGSCVQHWTSNKWSPCCIKVQEECLWTKKSLFHEEGGCLSVCLLVGCPYPKCLCSSNCWWIHHTDDVVFVGFWRQVACTW